MKKLLPFLILALTMALALPASAQTYTCSGPPVMTGTVGVQHSPPPNAIWLQYFTPWNGPPAESYSILVTRTDGVTGKISFGAPSGAIFRTTGCTSGPSGCSAPPPGKITSAKLETRFAFDPAGTNVAITSVLQNGVKVAEVFGVANIGSMQSTQTWSDGLAAIRQDTGLNSRVYFEGWNTVSGVTTWKSIVARFASNTCGSIP